MKFKDFYNYLSEDDKEKMNFLIFNAVALPPEFMMILYIIKSSYLNNGNIPTFVIPYIMMLLASALCVDCEGNEMIKKLRLGDYNE